MKPVSADSETKICDTTYETCHNKTSTVSQTSLAFIWDMVQDTI